jgi:hypothetical protein
MLKTSIALSLGLIVGAVGMNFYDHHEIATTAVEHLTAPLQRAVDDPASTPPDGQLSGHGPELELPQTEAAAFRSC